MERVSLWCVVCGVWSVICGTRPRAEALEVLEVALLPNAKDVWNREYVIVPLVGAGKCNL